jgi:Sec-independent protein translocase protein TatA
MPELTEDQKKALKAFKKRLKAHQMEVDSQLTRNFLSGNKEKILAIQPPSGFGRAVWEELAALGYLTPDGGGFYQLSEPKK